jgi:hypothetical protein
MGVSVLFASFLFTQMLAAALGEPAYYSQYRSGDYPYTNSYTYYTNPFQSFYNKYYSNPTTYKYRNYNYNTPTTYDDDRVYVTDMYGNTRVSSGRSLRGLQKFIVCLMILTKLTKLFTLLFVCLDFIFKLISQNHTKHNLFWMNLFLNIIS